MTRNPDARPRTHADAASGERETANSGSATDPGSTADSTAGIGSATREPGSTTGAIRPAVEVRSGETVVAECPYCGRPFAAERAHDLHVGEVHGAECTDAEREAYEAASEAERDDLFYFHLKVVAALGVLYGVVVLVYMFVLGSGLV